MLVHMQSATVATEVRLQPPFWRPVVRHGSYRGTWVSALSLTILWDPNVRSQSHRRIKNGTLSGSTAKKQNKLAGGRKQTSKQKSITYSAARELGKQAGQALRLRLDGRYETTTPEERRQWQQQPRQPAEALPPRVRGHLLPGISGKHAEERGGATTDMNMGRRGKNRPSLG